MIYPVNSFKHNCFTQFSEHYLNKLLTGDEQINWIDFGISKITSRNLGRILIIDGFYGKMENELAKYDFIKEINYIKCFPHKNSFSSEISNSKNIKSIDSSLKNFLKKNQSEFDLIIITAFSHICNNKSEISTITNLLYKALKDGGDLISLDDNVFEHLSQNKTNSKFLQITKLQDIYQHPIETEYDSSYLKHLDSLEQSSSKAPFARHILEEMRKIFEIYYCRNVGGGFFFPYMQNIYTNDINKDEINTQNFINDIKNLDQTLTCKKSVPELFTYFIARKSTKNEAEFESYIDKDNLNATELIFTANTKLFLQIEGTIENDNLAGLCVYNVINSFELNIHSQFAAVLSVRFNIAPTEVEFNLKIFQGNNLLTEEIITNRKSIKLFVSVVEGINKIRCEIKNCLYSVKGADEVLQGQGFSENNLEVPELFKMNNINSGRIECMLDTFELNILVN